MKVSIENEHLKASFDTKGAELQSICGIDSETEFLWCGDPNFWGKFSPVLFPIVGALKDDSYYYEDVKYQLPRHGFARDMEFEYEKINNHEITFTLSHSQSTIEKYPFEFVLKLHYQLSSASLCCTYEVINSSSKNMFFSIGAHPAFAAPLNNEGVYTDYFLQFNNDSEITYYHIVDNLISNQTSTVKLEEGKLPLTHEMFYNDALVFKDLKSTSISLINTKNYNGINFSFDNFPYFGIWAAKDADFVCLEPWCGIADGINHNQKLTVKEGINVLEPNTNWQRTWKVTCF
jgi:galactose mutarotase-like enzyme